MSDEFLSEAEELIDKMSQGLFNYEKALEKSQKINPDILNGIFRDAHTLKGSAGMFGYQAMGKLAHAMENLLDLIRLGKVKVNKSILDILFDTVDMLESMLSAKVPSVKVESLIQKLNTVEGNLNDIKQPTAKPIVVPENISQVLTEYEEFRLATNIRDNLNLVIVAVSFPFSNFDTALPKLTTWLQLINFQLLFATEVDLAKLGKVLEKRNIALKILRQV